MLLLTKCISPPVLWFHSPLHHQGPGLPPLCSSHSQPLPLFCLSSPCTETCLVSSHYKLLQLSHLPPSLTSSILNSVSWNYHSSLTQTPHLCVSPPQPNFCLRLSTLPSLSLSTPIARLCTQLPLVPVTWIPCHICTADFFPWHSTPPSVTWLLLFFLLLTLFCGNLLLICPLKERREAEYRIPQGATLDHLFLILFMLTLPSPLQVKHLLCSLDPHWGALDPFVQH